MIRIIQMTITISLVCGTQTFAQSNIDNEHKFAWGENIGWTNWRDADDALDGVLVGDTFLGGFMWSENVGWINVGDGDPADGMHYSNEDGSDFGVNINPDTGELSGLAWGENIGWINFDAGALVEQPALLDQIGCRFRGFVWGENIGWINLEDEDRYIAIKTCLGDVDCDARVELSDLLQVLACWGDSAGPADLDESGVVDMDDVLFVLANWGPCP